MMSKQKCERCGGRFTPDEWQIWTRQLDGTPMERHGEMGILHGDLLLCPDCNGRFDELYWLLLEEHINRRQGTLAEYRRARDAKNQGNNP